MIETQLPHSEKDLCRSAEILCTGKLDVIRKEAWLFCRTSSSVRLYWEHEEPKGYKGPGTCRREPALQSRPAGAHAPGESVAVEGPPPIGAIGALLNRVLPPRPLVVLGLNVWMGTAAGADELVALARPAPLWGYNPVCDDQPVSPYSGRDCAKSLRSSYTGFGPCCREPVLQF